MKYSISLDDRAYLNRGQNVKAVLDNYTAVWTPKLGFKSCADNFLNELDKGEIAIQDFETPTQGETEAKDEDKMDLAVFVASKAKIVIGYAKTNNLKDLRKQIDYSKTELYKMPQATMPLTIKRIRNIINDLVLNTPAIADYDITAATVADIDTKLDKFVNSRQKVKLITSHKQSVHKSVRFRIDNMNDQVDTMQDLVEIFSTSDRDFYKELSEAFTITDAAYGKISIRGYVNNSTENEPIDQVKVTLSGNEIEEVITETTELGYYQFKNIGYGVYTLKFERIGYKTITTTINVLEGERIEKDILMEPEEM